MSEINEERFHNRGQYMPAMDVLESQGRLKTKTLDDARLWANNMRRGRMGSPPASIETKPLEIFDRSRYYPTITLNFPIEGVELAWSEEDGEIDWQLMRARCYELATELQDLFDHDRPAFLERLGELLPESFMGMSKFYCSMDPNYSPRRMA